MPVAFEIGKPLPRHPKYDTQSRARDFWRRSDDASHTYTDGLDAKSKPILPQLPSETAEDYEWRRTMAVSPRYVSSIISLFNSIVTRTDATRPKPTDGSQAAELEKNADGMGTSLPQVIADELRRGQVEGVGYLLADTDAVGPQAIGQKARPLIRRLSGDSVVWWRDYIGQVVEAVAILCDRDGTDFAWYVTETTTQRIDLRREDSGALFVKGVGPVAAHKYGGCPLVRINPLFGSRDKAGDDSQAAPIAEQQRIITNLDSLERIEVFKATFSMWAFIGVDPNSVEKATTGSGRGLCLPMGANVASMGSDPAQADSIRKSVEKAVSTMLLAAGLSPGNPLQAGAPESGIAKAYKYNETEARLSALATAAQGAENLIRQRALAGVGAEDPGDCKWPDSFRSPDVSIELDITVKALSSVALPQVIKDVQVRKFAAESYELTPEQEAELTVQLKAGATQAAADVVNPFLKPPAARMSGT